MITQITKQGVAILTITAEKGNALDENDLIELQSSIKGLENNSNIAGIIIKGASKAFSTGLNIYTVLSLDTDKRILDFFQLLDEFLISLFSLNKPYIAIVNGHSIGAGFLIQLCSDFTFLLKNDKSKFGLPELKIGLAIDLIMKQIVAYNSIDGKCLSKLIYAGELFNSRKAFEFGLIDDVFEDFEIEKKSIEKILSIRESGPIPFEINKKTIRAESLNKMKGALEKQSYSIFIELLRQEQTRLNLRKILIDSK